MTLVVAKHIKEEICILADAKITNRNRVRHGPLTGALKAVILHPDLCVCYAANKAGWAQVAIRRLNINPAETFEPEAVISSLLKEHQAGADDPDFIVACLRPEISLSRIWKGEVEHGVSNCWLGDDEAFVAYQEHFHESNLTNPRDVQGNEEENSKVISNMLNAFQAVLRQGHPSIGDFMVSVASTSNGFIYMEAAIVFPVPQVIPSGISTVIRFGDTAEGGYGYSLLTPRKSGIGAVGIYFPNGRLGALFYPVKADHSKPDEAVPYYNVSYDEFIALVQRDYGVEIDGPRIG